jgi:surfeit locus 1 family protein
VDRGWVQAGERATDRPKLPLTPTKEIEITGRIRLNSSLPRGSFFALPASGDLVSSWNLRSKVKTEDFYIDLISGEGVTPSVPAELPELSDGPHMAYALQWIFFAGLIVYGRLLIRKR